MQTQKQKVKVKVHELWAAWVTAGEERENALSQCSYEEYENALRKFLKMKKRGEEEAGPLNWTARYTQRLYHGFSCRDDI